MVKRTKIPVEIDKDSDTLYLIIPERYIPTIEKKILPRKKSVNVEVTRYGGKGKTIRPGIEGFYPIPLDMTITHIYRNGKWIRITEKPMGQPGKRRENVWRSQIPAKIYRQYNILPRDYIRIAYKTITPDFIVPIQYRDIISYARWYPAYKTAFWIIPEDLTDFPTIKQGYLLGSAIADLFIYNNQIYIDFIFPGVERDLIRKGLGGYRVSAVINVSLKDKDSKKYKFKCDIRTQFLSVLQRTMYIDPNDNLIPITDCCAWTNKNLLDGNNLLWNVSKGLKSNQDVRDKHFNRNKITHFRKEPEITTENVKTGKIIELKNIYQGIESESISYGETFVQAGEEYGRPYPFDHAIKEIDYPIRKTIYYNKDIEKTFPDKWIWMDQNGFVWWRRKKD